MNSHGPRWTQAGTRYWPANDISGRSFPPRPWGYLLAGLVLASLVFAINVGEERQAGAQAGPAAADTTSASYRHVHQQYLGLRSRLQCLKKLPPRLDLRRALHKCDLTD